MKVPVRVVPAGFSKPLLQTIFLWAIAAMAQLLASQAVKADLVGHWRFDESSGTVARDVTGKHDGQLAPAGAQFVQGGISGNAVQLDRNQNGFVQLPAMPGLVGSNFTVIVWMKIPAGDTTAETYPLTLHEAWFSNGFLIMLNQVGGFGAPGKASFYLSNESQTGISTSNLNDGRWHQVALTYDPAGQTAFFVDGAPPEVTIASAPTIERSPPLLVGGVYGQDLGGVAKGTFSGWVDDVQVYNQTLTASQIQELFENPGRDLQEMVQPIRISPHGGKFVNSVEVALESAVPGAVVRYTVDDSEPVAASSLYAMPITVRQTTTLKARLFVNEFPVSEIVSARFTQVPPIAFNPPGGLFTNSANVTLENNLGVGTLSYTLDGSDPLPNSPSYTGAITLTNAATIRARLFVNGFPASEIATGAFQRVYALDDGLPNDWRERHFGVNYATDPRVTATADPDGDGWNNLTEFQNNTDPLNKASAPAIIAGIQAVPRVSWNSVPGSSYRVLRKSNAAAATWEVVLPAFRAVEPTSRYIDADAPASALYQIELLP